MRIQDHGDNKVSAINQGNITRHALAARFHLNEARRNKNMPSMRSYHIMAVISDVYAARLAMWHEVTRLGSKHPQYETIRRKLEVFKQKNKAQNERHYRTA